MDLNDYGPFAAVVAIAAALVSTFALLLIKSVGRLKKWTWLIHDAPDFLVAAGARAFAVGMIALTFLTINSSNALFFSLGSIIFAGTMVYLVSKFNKMRKIHIHGIPVSDADGTHAVDKDGNKKYEYIIIGTESTMNSQSKGDFININKQYGPTSLDDFISGLPTPYDVKAVWSPEHLAEIGNRLTMLLMGIVLCGVMALYLAASSVEAFLRVPAIPDQETVSE